MTKEGDGSRRPLIALQGSLQGSGHAQPPRARLPAIGGSARGGGGAGGARAGGSALLPLREAKLQLPIQVRTECSQAGACRVRGRGRHLSPRVSLRIPVVLSTTLA